MFRKVDDSRFVEGEHEVLRLWQERNVFRRLIQQNAGKPKWSFLDGPITANNPMGVHHAWGRTYKDAYQRYFAMTGHELRYQNGFDCQGLWVEVEVEKELKLGTKTAIIEYGIDKFVRACKQRVLKFAARQTEQSIRLGYWMEWDEPDELRKLAAGIGSGLGSRDEGLGFEPSSPSTINHQLSVKGTAHSSLVPSPSTLSYRNARGAVVTGTAEDLTARLGNPEWGGSYFTFSTENNETIWTFLKKCFERRKIYMGHDVMPWSGRGGSAYSQMEVADGRKLTTHRSCFVRFPVIGKGPGSRAEGLGNDPDTLDPSPSTLDQEYLLVWTTTPWTLTSNVACMVNPDLDYVQLKAKKDGAVYYFAKENLEYKRLEKEFKEGFGRPEWGWPEGVGKLKTIAQIFKEQGGYEIVGELKGADMIGWRYAGPFDELEAQLSLGGHPFDPNRIQAIQSAVHSGNARIGNQELSVREFRSSIEKLFNIQLPARPEHLETILQGLAAPINMAGAQGVHTLGWVEPSLPAIERALLNLGLAAPTLDAWDSMKSDIGRIEKLVHIDQLPDTNGYENCWSSFLGSVFTNFDSICSDLEDVRARSSVSSHRIIDGGRDSKGSPNVVAGEGTGIVHTAPGCGDIDHKIGVELGLPIIAPLGEDGRYMDGFGPFTGKEAISPEVAEMVFESLKAKGYLVYVETYPHIYPHCWRTGDELVFRLVDEWFINMDWREEIKDVTRCINWIPDSIQGQEREVEWLTTMRDWMISKKRFWGLALPIWVNPNDPGDFEVIGSLAELKERAVEGWDDFQGHTPHRPWIDKVKIKSTKTGAVLHRIEDVGNPWLDAGIVPFSTLPRPKLGSRNEELATSSSILDSRSSDWFPADFVTECFPGQFRNWFYSLLSLSTMMGWRPEGEPQLTPDEKKPFKNLLGHRLVMNEQGQPMHKSDGTAIWFEEAAEQLGVDTLRWLYLAQNPASDLRFGTRHPKEPVTLQTVEGPISQTKEGLATCKVTSTPADDIRRMVLIPLWNSYAFFVNYAVLDGFDPSLAQVPLAERPEIDRWVLSRLQELTQVAHDSFQAFDVARFMQAAQEYIDDLSNWYIRRNRRRFWRAREGQGLRAEGQGQKSSVPPPSTLNPQPAWDSDKLAAYQTLHEVLLTLTKLLAPCIPFLTERMYQNLVQSPGSRVQSTVPHPSPSSLDPRPLPDSVHLCPYPVVDPSKLDPELNWATHQVQALVTLGHRLRETAEQRVRQPLAELRFACRDEKQAQALLKYADVIGDELNVKHVVRADNLDDLVSYAYKPNLKTLGPKYGKILKSIGSVLPTLAASVLAPLRNGQSVTISVEGQDVVLEPNDVMVSVQQASDWASADNAGIQVALSTKLTPELVREGMARDLVRHIQQLRKDASLEENDRIRVGWSTKDGKSEIDAVLVDWGTMLRTETRADSIEPATTTTMPREVTVGDVRVTLWLIG